MTDSAMYLVLQQRQKVRGNMGIILTEMTAKEHPRGEAFWFCAISLGVLSNTSKTSLTTSHNVNDQLRQALNLATFVKSFHKVQLCTV